MKPIALLTGMWFVAAASIPMSISATEIATPQTQVNSITASGIVVDADGEPLVGATVREKNNPKNATLTDINGHYALKVAPGAYLEISYIGFVTAKIQAAADVETTLAGDQNNLNEVVVVGFGKQKKVNLTGSVSVADKKVLESRPVSNAAAALQGAVPGLNITQTQGDLETNPSINIRGTGTIGSGSSGSPLILIDGMEADINVINPQDIESISVLKYMTKI